MKFDYNKLALYFIGILLIVIILIVSFWTFTGNISQKIIYEDDSVKVVRDYFNAWDKKNYEAMYNLVSDNFKQNEPTAKNFVIYKSFMASQEVFRVNIIEISNFEKKDDVARIKYTVEFININGVKNVTSSEFTVKYKINDTLPGWKLIHPYGRIVGN